MAASTTEGFTTAGFTERASMEMSLTAVQRRTGSLHHMRRPACTRARLVDSIMEALRAVPGFVVTRASVEGFTVEEVAANSALTKMDGGHDDTGKSRKI